MSPYASRQHFSIAPRCSRQPGAQGNPAASVHAEAAGGPVPPGAVSAHAWQASVPLGDGRTLQVRVAAGGVELRVDGTALLLPAGSLPDACAALSKAAAEATWQAMHEARP